MSLPPPLALVYSRFLMSIPADTLSELGHTTDSTQGSDLFSSASSRTQEGPVALPACIFPRLHHILEMCVMLNKNYYDWITFIHFGGDVTVWVIAEVLTRRMIVEKKKTNFSLIYGRIFLESWLMGNLISVSYREWLIWGYKSHCDLTLWQCRRIIVLWFMSFQFIAAQHLKTDHSLCM